MTKATSSSTTPQRPAQPGPVADDPSVDPKEAKRASKIAAEDAEARQKDEVVMRKPKSGEGGTDFTYGEVDTKAQAKAVDISRAAEKDEGGTSFGYGERE